MASRRRWRFLNTGACPAAWNMAVDEAVWRACGEGRVPPTVRFYGWEPPAVSVGYAQHLAREVNLERCHQEGVDVVRRPTGGRAVFHCGELTYSVAWRCGSGVLPDELHASTQAIGHALIRGLARLGIRGEMASRRARRLGSHARNPACFLTHAPHEIVVGGRKLIGSAQRRDGRANLQQGSILIADEVERLVALLRSPSGDGRGRYLRSARLMMTSIAEELRGALPFEEVCRAFREAFEEVLGGPFEDGGLTPYERELAERTMKEKYGAPQWTERR